MDNIKLIKSFIVKKHNDNLKKGDIIVLRKYQGQIPLLHEELYFESKETGKNFTLKFLISNIDKNLEIHEKFNSLGEKFDYLT
jgi:hypothetical protein